jgi:hypothetical protein
MKPLRLAVLVFAAAVAASADTITLNDGRTYDGSIVEETETHVKIRTAKATLTLARKDIADITRGGSSPIPERDARLEALTPSEPEGYLETAEWLCKEGRGALDISILRRLCNISAVFDRKSACRAQLLLAAELFKSGDRQGAARAYVRAFNADPANEEAKKKSDEMRVDLEAVMKKEMAELGTIMDLILVGNYAEAAPRMKRAKTLGFSDRATDYMATTMAALADDLQSRVPCKPCGGTATAVCGACKGKCVIRCSTCDGKGKKKGFVAGEATTSIANSVCRTCIGMGSLLCIACKAERTVTVNYGGTVLAAPVTIPCVAGKERDALREAVDMTKYTKPGTEINVSSIAANTPTAGGRLACPTCRGIAFNPPSTPPDLEGIRKFRDAINDRLTGKVPIDVEGRAGGVHDEELLGDGGYYYRKGQWVESGETK